MRSKTTTTPSVGQPSEQTFTYDAAGRLEQQRLDGLVIADPAYDPASGDLVSVAYPSGAGNGGNGTALALTRDDNGRLKQLAWQLAGGQQLVDTVTRSRSSNVLTNTVTLGGQTQADASHTYDTAGRLTTATVGRLAGAAMASHQLSYGFGPATTCGDLTGAVANAGANGNRTRSTDTFGGQTTTVDYCYDGVDLLMRAATAVDGTATTTLAPAYDAEGNTTTLGDQTLGYDAADRHLSTNVTDGTHVAYTRDATDRIVARTTAPGTEQGEAASLKYGHTGDAADYTLNADGQVLERTISLPGGVLYTWRPQGSSWAYPNIHGDLIAQADTTGTLVGSLKVYDPFGQPLDPATGAIGTQAANEAVPDTGSGQLDYGWVGQHQRAYEHAGSITIIEWAPANTSPPWADSCPSTRSRAATAMPISTPRTR